LQTTITRLSPFHLPLFITLVVLWLFRRKTMRIAGVRILQGPLSALNSTQSFWKRRVY
jgi:mannose/fructose/N-acetylgalactosamine-specific phosphotransferase system component IID